MFVGLTLRFTPTPTGAITPNLLRELSSVCRVLGTLRLRGQISCIGKVRSRCFTMKSSERETEMS